MIPISTSAAVPRYNSATWVSFPSNVSSRMLMVLAMYNINLHGTRLGGGGGHNTSVGVHWLKCVFH